MSEGELEFEKFKKYVSEYLVGEDKQLEIIYAGIQAAKKTGTVPAFLLRGPPGAGKTYITKVIAEYFGAQYIFIQTTLNTSEDELLYKYIPSEDTKSGIKILYGPLPEALEKSKKTITVLVLDEFDKTRPSTDSLLLDYIQNTRVSFRIDETEDIIEGNKQNLIIFLTSNDNREFSEPLLRRLITVVFQPPSPKAVETLLSKEFSDKIIKLLSKLYVASLHANMSKPITIQELRQLGYALQVMPEGNFNDLLFSFAVKTYEDMEKLSEALQTETQSQQENLPDVGQALVQHQEEQQQEEQEKKQEQSVQQILASIKIPKDEVINAEKIDAENERTFLTSVNSSFTEYSEIIKTFEPTPAERPDVLGKFQVIDDDSALKITASTPLSLEEVQKLLINQSTFEAYAEDFLYVPTIHEIINIAKENNLNITYYTKNLIILKNINIIIRLELIKEKLFKLKMYINAKNSGEDKKLLSNLLAYQQNFVLKKFLENLQWRHYEIISGKYFNVQEYKDLAKFLEITGIDAKLIIESSPQLFISISKGTPETKYTIDYEISNSNIELKIKRIDVTTEKTVSNNSIKNIINKYAGTYDLLDGLNKLKEMDEEIQIIGDKQ